MSRLGIEQMSSNSNASVFSNPNRMTSDNRNHEAGGVRREVGQTSSVIPAPPPTPRQGIEADGRNGTFTMLSYNVLSDVYVTSERYNYCPLRALEWRYRRHNLLREIVAYDADILCLQEVQSNHYEEFFVPELEKHGYTGVYCKKKNEEIYTGSGYVNDGCATFYRRDCFSLLGTHEVNFNLKAAEAMCEAIRPVQPNENIVAMRRLYKANTHVCANKELKDVKLWQVLTLLKELEKIRAYGDFPMLLAGDFNSVPGSAPHCLLSTGRVDPAHPDLQFDPLNILKPPSKLFHSLPLVSAYASFGRMNGIGPTVEKHRRRMDVNTEEPQFTNCTRYFRGTLDYIFYTVVETVLIRDTFATNTLMVESLLELLDEDSVRKDTGLPSPDWPSDHIALLAEFRFKQTNSHFTG